MQLAERIPLEIVSVDSAQVYRGMDIGTAKPSATDRTAVPHHLIDIRDPADPYSAADFVRDATVAIRQIRVRGKLPLLVGGTMLYAKALRDGLSDLPSADPKLRARIEAEARELGWPELHARLAKVDPSTAARLKPNDSQRIQRALEVYETAGVPMSELVIPDTAPRLKLPTLALLPSRPRVTARAHRRSASMPCSTPGCSMKFASCTRAATFIPIFRRCAASAIDRRGASSTVNVRSKSFVRRASPLRGSWPRGR